jgi:hypothetical protein
MEGVKKWVGENIPGAQLPDVDVIPIKEDSEGGNVGSTRRGANHEPYGGQGQLRFRVVPYSRPTTHTTNPKGLPDSSVEVVEPDPHTNAATMNRGSSSGSIAALFALLEANKEKLGFEYYSISPTTLDQVFLRIVGAEEQDRKAEQETQGTKKRWWFWRKGT